jgi:hypothetical protein
LIAPNVSAPTSFAAVAAKAKDKVLAKKKAGKVALGMMKPRTDPLKFTKLHLKINDSRPIKACGTAKEVNELFNNLLNNIGIRKDVFLYSKIGNSILEIFVPDDETILQRVMDKLVAKKVETLDYVNPTTVPAYAKCANAMEMTAVRLAFLYKKAQLKNLKECILQDCSAELIELVKSKISPKDAPRDAVAIMGTATTTVTTATAPPTDIVMDEDNTEGQQMDQATDSSMNL